MPFCTHCGTTVDTTAAFCAKCGSRQPGIPSGGPPPRPSPGEEWLQSTSPSTASTLCYIPFVGWVVALIVLSSHRFREDRLVRFHAFQGMYLSVLWLLADLVLGSVFGIVGIIGRRTITATLKLSVVAAWVYMLYKTSIGDIVRLPFLGELADRSVAEQSSGRI
jgi:uncharacterized membrane protein